MELVRSNIRELHDALRARFGPTPLFAVDTPADKFLGQMAIRNRLHSINGALRTYFTPIRYTPFVVNTGNPHYTLEERRELARVCERTMSPLVANLPR